MKNQWFPYEFNEYNSKPMVFCFHHAGGSAATFRKWTNVKEVNFIPVELPGRGAHGRTNLTMHFIHLINQITEIIYPITKGKKFFLYGHSMGALIVFNICVLLAGRYGIRPEKIIVAGREAPHMPDMSPFKSYMSDHELVNEIIRLGGTPIELLENREFLNYFLPIIRNDYKLIEDFRYGGEKVNVPIIAHSAYKDTEANPEIMKHWKEVTNDKFVLNEFRGNHFFINDMGDKYVSHLVHQIKNEI